MDNKSFALGCIAIVATLEGAAMLLNKDGAVFAALTAIIGAVAGAAMGFTFGKSGVSNNENPPTL